MVTREAQQARVRLIRRHLAYAQRPITLLAFGAPHQDVGVASTGDLNGGECASTAEQDTDQQCTECAFHTAIVARRGERG